MFTKAKGSDPAITPSTPAQNAVRSAAGKPSLRSAPSIISADMTIKGSIQSSGEMQIDGIIEGDVTGSSLTIGQTGQIIGEVRAEAVTVRGKVVGSIRARKVELETGSRVDGDILHASLSIQSNAVFEGQVKHADDPLKSSTLPTTDSAASAASSKTKPTLSSTKPAEKTSGTDAETVPVKTGFGPTTT